jgi:Domain of unknown function (DUF5979)
MKSSLLTSWALWIFMLVGATIGVRAATLTVNTVVDAAPSGVAFSATERYVITASCFDSAGAITPSNGASQTGVPGQPVEFLGLPVNTNCSVAMTTKPTAPAGYLLTSDNNGTYGISVGPSGGRLDIVLRLRAALSIPLTLEVVGETPPANATFPFSGYCNGEVSRNFSGSIAPGQELRIPDVAANSSCQVSFTASQSVGGGLFVIASQAANQFINSNADRIVLKLALAGSASLQLNVTTDLVGSTAKVTGQADCIAPATLYSNWNRVNFPFSTGEMALGTSKTIPSVPAGLECILAFPNSIVTGVSTLARPPVYSPAKVITIGAKTTTTTATINYLSETGQLITLNSSYPAGTVPSGVTTAYAFSCQDSAGQFETIRFTGVGLTGTFNSPSRIRSGLVCTQSEAVFSPSALTSSTYLRAPTLSPSSFTTSASAATVLQITHRPTALDATISGKATVTGGTLPAGTAVNFTPSNCYFEGVFLALPSGNSAISVPLNAATFTPLVSVPAGTQCYFQTSGIPSAPTGTAWIQDNKWPSYFQLTALAGQNELSLQGTLVPTTAVTFNFFTNGLPAGAQWNLNVNSSLTCSINGTSFAQNLGASASNTNTQVTLALPIGAVCSFQVAGCCSLSSPPGYSVRAAASAVTGIVISGASQSQNITLQFAKIASLEISAAITSFITAGAAPPSIYFSLRCENSSDIRSYSVTVGSSNKVTVNNFDFNSVLVEGTKCTIFGFSGNGFVATPSATSNWFAASRSFDITLVGGVNQFAIPVVERKNGTFTHTINAIAQLAPNSLFFPTIFCTPSAASLNQTNPLYGLTNQNAIAPGVIQTSTSLPADSVCRQQISPSAGTVPLAGYAWTFPKYEPGAEFTIISDATVAVSATPQVVGDATVTIVLSFDSAQYESALIPSAKLVCELAPGVQKTYSAGSVNATPQRQFIVTVPSVPSAASCRVVGVVNDAEKYLNLDTLSPSAIVPAGASSISATLIYRPLQSLSVNLVEQGGVTTSGVFYPSLICSVAGFSPGYIQSPQLNGVIGPDTRTYIFQNIPETAQCIVSLKRFASADATSAFAFAALSQQTKIGSSNNSITMTSRVYPATSIVVSLPVTGVPAGTTSVQVKCTAQGAGLENWVGTRAAAPVGGSVTVASVPAGASCSVVIAGADLPRPPAGTQWAQSSYSSATFVPDAAGTTKVSINLNTVSAGNPTAQADHASGHPIPTLSWESLLALLLLISGLAYAGVSVRGRRRI